VPVVAVLVAALLLAACGSNGDANDGVASLDGSASGGDSTETSDEEADREEALLEFAECMRDNGIDMPDPQVGEGGGVLFQGPGGGRNNEEDFNAAMEACQDLLPRGGEAPDEQQQAAMQDAMLEFAQCMRAEGIDMPDPEFSGDGGGRMRITQGSGADPNSDEFRAAEEKCRPIMEEAARDAGLEAPGGGSS
jgi:hypothetical protein